jgi:nicotinamide-nucleotide amidase
LVWILANSATERLKAPPMRAEIISIGDELTSGERLDTNTQWIAQRLNEIGLPVAFHSTVSDDLAGNVLVFRQACERADVIVSSGGLGPTADDLTRFALADLAGVELVQDDAALAHIRSIFARRAREMPATNLVQAKFPRGSRTIFNPHGTAPGIDLEMPRPGKTPARIFCLPGVPAEMREMWQGTVSPAIQQMLGVTKVIAHYRVKCFGVGESDLEAMLPDLIARGRYPTVGITVSKATITLRVTAAGETPGAARASMVPTLDTIHECLGDLIFGYEDDELQHAVVRLLRERGQRLAVVESGTGGLICNWLCDCPDGKDVLQMGSVLPRFESPPLSLATEALEPMQSSFLRELAEMGRRSPDVDYCLAVGPFPDAEKAATGSATFEVALAHAEGVEMRSFPYTGHPDILKPRAAKQSLNLLRLHLKRRDVIAAE